MANEWNELQAYRKTSVSLQMLAMMFLLEYLEFGNWAKLRPGFGANRFCFYIDVKIGLFRPSRITGII